MDLTQGGQQVVSGEGDKAEAPSTSQQCLLQLSHLLCRHQNDGCSLRGTLSQRLQKAQAVAQTQIEQGDVRAILRQVTARRANAGTPTDEHDIWRREQCVPDPCRHLFFADDQHPHGRASLVHFSSLCTWAGIPSLLAHGAEP